MGQIIEIGKKRGKDAGPPRVICPRCNAIIEINLDIWKKNVSELFKVNCYKCRGEIFLGMMILAHPQLKGLIGHIQRMVQAINPKNLISG